MESYRDTVPRRKRLGALRPERLPWDGRSRFTWWLGRFPPLKLIKWEGELIAMTDQWIIVKEGSDENWIPREKVMLMKASK